MTESDIKQLYMLGEFNIHKFKKLDIYIQNHIFDETKFLPTDCSISERLFCFSYALTNKPICKNCSNPTVFTYWLKKSQQKYRTFCSNKCSNNDDAVKHKKEQSYISKYGVSNPSQSSIIKNKKRKTIGDSCGGFGFASNIIRSKIFKTIKEKYNVDKVEEIPEWIKFMKIFNGSRKFYSASKESMVFIEKYIKERGIDPMTCMYGENELWLSYKPNRRYFYDLVVFKDINAKELKDLNSIVLILEYDGWFWHPNIDQAITYRNEYFGITKIKSRELYLKDLHKELIARKFCNNFIRIRNQTLSLIE